MGRLIVLPPPVQQFSFYLNAEDVVITAGRCSPFFLAIFYAPSQASPMTLTHRTATPVVWFSLLSPLLEIFLLAESHSPPGIISWVARFQFASVSLSCDLPLHTQRRLPSLFFSLFRHRLFYSLLTPIVGDFRSRTLPSKGDFCDFQRRFLPTARRYESHHPGTHSRHARRPQIKVEHPPFFIRDLFDIGCASPK